MSPLLIVVLSTVVSWLASAEGIAGRPNLAVKFDPQLQDFSPASVRLAAVSVSGGMPLEAPLGRDSTAALSLPPGGPWRVSCTGPLVWCPTIDVPSLPAQLTIPIFRASKVSGRLRVPRGEALPKSLLVQGTVRRPAKDRPIEIRSRVETSRGAFNLALPQALLDLRLVAESWAPRYLWDVQPRGGTHDLGTVDLRSGSSVSGFVVDPTTLLPVDAQASLMPLMNPDTEAEQERAKLSVARAQTASRGFFQFRGIAPGRYRLELRGRNQAVTTVDPVEVVLSAETHLGEIGLSPLVSLEVAVSPPRDAAGGSWRVRLRRQVSGSFLGAEPLELDTDEDGAARFVHLQAGRYELHVLDGSGSRLHRQLEEVLADRRLAIALPLITVKGTVTLGESPLAATVALAVGESDSVSLQSGEDGRFEGWMRRPPHAFVMADVRSDNPRLQRQVELRDVEVKDSGLELDLRLKDVSLSGTVVDDEARPVPNALVTAEVTPYAFLGSVSASADKLGRFMIRAVPEGPMTVWPYHDRFPAAPTVDVDTTGGRSVADMELVLGRGRTVRGQLLSGEGEPVPGAEVIVDAVGVAPAERALSTDVAGRFTVVVPRDTATVHVRVRAPTHMMWSACLPLPADDEWMVSLPPLPPSELRLRIFAQRDQAPRTDGQFVLYRQGGGVLTHNDWNRWQRALRGDSGWVEGSENGRQYSDSTIPAVAPGVYALTWTAIPQRELVARTCMIGFPPELKWAPVGPAGQATLTYAMAAPVSSSKD